MRGLAELGPVRATLDSQLAWPLLMSLRAEQEHVGSGSPFTASIFTLGWNADIPAARVRPLLEELVDAEAITAEVQPDGRMFTVLVL